MEGYSIVTLALWAQAESSTYLTPTGCCKFSASQYMVMSGGHYQQYTNTKPSIASCFQVLTGLPGLSAAGAWWCWRVSPGSSSCPWYWWHWTAGYWCHRSLIESDQVIVAAGWPEQLGLFSRCPLVEPFHLSWRKHVEWLYFSCMRVDVKYIISINSSWAAALDLLNLYVNFILTCIISDLKLNNVSGPENLTKTNDSHRENSSTC